MKTYIKLAIFLTIAMSIFNQTSYALDKIKID